MRARLIFTVLAILLLAGFVLLNVPEFLRSAPLSLGWRVVEAPLGLIMLSLLGVTLLFFLVSSATLHSRYALEANRNAKALQAQRDLADKAEASRFTDLRQQLDSHLRDNRQREAIAASEFEKSMVLSQRELRNQLEAINRTIDARMGELESRLDARLDRFQPAAVPGTTPVDVAPRERTKV
jgi:hypothetical protein